jgi:hypothetical protein
MLDQKKDRSFAKRTSSIIRLLAVKVIMSLTPCDQIREAAAPSNSNDQEHHDHNIGTIDSSIQCATKYSNLQFKSPEGDPVKEVKSLNLERVPRQLMTI